MVDALFILYAGGTAAVHILSCSGGRYEMRYVDSLSAFGAVPEHSSSPFSSHVGDDVVGGRT